MNRQHDDVAYVLVSEQEIDKITTEIANKISEDFKDEEHVLLVGILKGSMPFMSDIISAMVTPPWKPERFIKVIPAGL